VGFRGLSIKTSVDYYKESYFTQPRLLLSDLKNDPVKTLGVIGRNKAAPAFKGQIILPNPHVKKSIHCKVGLEPTIMCNQKSKGEKVSKNDRGKANDVVGKVIQISITIPLVCRKSPLICSVGPAENKEQKVALIIISAEIYG
jgi:hypothetical protein